MLGRTESRGIIGEKLSRDSSPQRVHLSPEVLKVTTQL